MFSITTLDANNSVVSINFDLLIQPMYQLSHFGSVDHESIAEEISKEGLKVSSAIIQTFRLRDDLWDDPKHMHQTNNLGISEFDGRAYDFTTYMSLIDAKEELQKRGISLTPNNYDLEEQSKYESQLVDSVFNAQKMLSYEYVINDFKEEFKEELNYVDPSCLISTILTDGLYNPVIDFPEDEWKAFLFEKCLIYPYTTYERVYHMPNPFCYWDYRNDFQQWFFVKKEDKIEYIVGGSGSSGQRENMGRWAHVFATLAKKYNYKIPTYALQYREDNVLYYKQDFPTFKVVCRELTGNYQANWGEAIKLFEGLYFDLELESFI